MQESRLNYGDRGFSLLETVIATGLIAGAITALAQMFAISVANNISARSGSYATVLAGQKMSSCGARHGLRHDRLPAADLTTDTAAPIDAGWRHGAEPSPGGLTAIRLARRLRRPVRPYSRGGETMPARAVYTRRWSIAVLPGHPDTLVLLVLVTRRANRGSADAAGATLRLSDEARVVSLKTRKAP